MTSNEATARARAEAFRRANALGLAPVKDAFELVHTTTAVDVLSMDAGEAEHGLSMLDPVSGRAVIVVATTIHPTRQRSSIAHELCHVLAGDLTRRLSDEPGARTASEIRADAFARHLLVPLGAVRARWTRGSITLTELSALVQEFEVSPAVAAIQFKMAGLIDTATCAAWQRVTTRSLAAQNGWLSQHRSLVADSSRPRAPQALMTRAVAGYRLGVLSITELALWYGQSPSDLAADLGAPTQAAALDEDWDSDAPLFPDVTSAP